MAQPQKIYFGEVCAYLGLNAKKKGTYRRIGTAFKDDRGRISLVIDTIPIAQSNWKGWINIFENDPEDAVAKREAEFDDNDNDIPF